MAKEPGRRKGRRKKSLRRRVSLTPTKPKGGAAAKPRKKTTVQQPPPATVPPAEQERRAADAPPETGAPPLPPRETQPAGELGKTTPDYPCLCPGEKYPITRAVCLGRQERNYGKCPHCEYRTRGRRPRGKTFEET